MSKDSNLEFRKVPSLKFLYEISQDGRFLRNVKSKKYEMPVCQNDEYVFPRLSVKAKDLVNECWPQDTVRVQINDRKFSSIKAATIWLSMTTNANPELIRSKMKQRRKHILGYDVTYLNAETGHAGPKGQGTVH